MRSLKIAAPAVAVLAVLLAAAPPAGRAQAQERCYGVALAGENDGLGAEEDPGSASVAYQGDAWSWVAQGSCLILDLPPQSDGTPRRGSFEPLDRDRAGS